MPGTSTLAATRRSVIDLIAARALDIALQPIVDLGTGAMVGAEALARFHDGRAPVEWFGAAGKTGQSFALNALACSQALVAFCDLPERCYLSVNASPELVTRGELARRIDAVDVPLERLVIEITEHVQILDYAALLAALAPLRERGARLAIDDTGAGYASLTHVLQLRPDIIKIDRSLVTGITDDRARRTLVTALVLLALDLDATVTAEGVETAGELETLATLGVDCAQGHLLAVPSTDPARWSYWAHTDWPAHRGAA
jgi:EAL domain-containing protein (putative c-di-GMP-specific phosphodiesterase class I)